MKQKCATVGCRNDAADIGLCRKHLKQVHEAKTAEVESGSSDVAPSVDRGYHARAAADRVAQGGAEFTKAYLELAAKGRRLIEDDPIVQGEDEPVPGEEDVI